MQIAKIIPKIRTQNKSAFDYAIPPELLPQIQIGLLVLIPFHGRKIEGIIIDIKRSTKVLELKSIIKIIDPIPVVDRIHIDLAKWMSKYYLAPISQTLFLNIVPPAIRSIQSSNSINNTIKYNRIQYRDIYHKPLLIIGDFKDRLKYYQEAIKISISQNRSVIILVPDLSLIKYFKIKAPIILHANLSKTVRWQIWDKIRNNNNAQIIIGSQSALFAPIKNLGLIIIDQEENETYKNDRAPRFNASAVAGQLAKLYKNDLIFGSLTPSIDSFNYALKNKYRLIKRIDKNKTKVLTINIDSNQDILNPFVIDKINEVCMSGNKVMLYFERKNFKVNEIKSLLPRKKIINIDKESISTFKNDWDIAIVTSYALKFLIPNISLVVIVNADLALDYPDFRAAERAFAKIYKFIKVGDQAIIQCKNPQSQFISSLANLDLNNFYKTEIENRKRFLFPPVCRLIRIICRGKTEDDNQKITAAIYRELETNFANYKSFLISPPAPAFIYFKNKYFRSQIVIRLLGKRPKELDDYLTKLPNSCLVDVDPIDLL